MQAAQTRLRTCARSPPSRARAPSLICAPPRAQLRRHMQMLGHPMIGDKRYPGEAVPPLAPLCSLPIPGRHLSLLVPPTDGSAADSASSPDCRPHPAADALILVFFSALSPASDSLPPPPLPVLRCLSSFLSTTPSPPPILVSAPNHVTRRAYSITHQAT